MNPSANTKPLKNGSFARLQSWMNAVGVPHWDFTNVVPHKIGDVTLDDVPWDVLKAWCGERRVIVCLGGFVARAIKKVDTGDSVIICIDHPSPRNRNFNDPAYEPEMLKRLKQEIEDALK